MDDKARDRLGKYLELLRRNQKIRDDLCEEESSELEKLIKELKKTRSIFSGFKEYVKFYFPKD